MALTDNQIKAMAGSSGDNDWQTPRTDYEKFNHIFHFTLDAAANAENALCNAYWTKEDDGLVKPWNHHAAVWVNCPYGKENGPFGEGVLNWVVKAIKESRTPIVGTEEDPTPQYPVVCLLTKAATATEWCQLALASAKLALYYDRRIKFKNNAPDKEKKNQPTFDNLFTIFHPVDHPKDFVWYNQLSKLGHVDWLRKQRQIVKQMKEEAIRAFTEVP